MSLKLVSINIEYDKHFDTVLPFLRLEQPDIVCVQELFLVDIPRLQEELNMGFLFFPCTRMEAETQYNIAPRGIGGFAMFSRLPFVQAKLQAYSGDPGQIKTFGKPNDEIRGVIAAEYRKGSDVYTIATTHFTWTPKGEPNEAQRTDVVSIKHIIDLYPEVIFTGDMNAPRGGEIFARLSEGLTDAIPPEIVTTIDPKFHYSGGLDLVVDALFLSKHYHADTVRVVGGVSDHKAVVTEISRVN